MLGKSISSSLMVDMLERTEERREDDLGIVLALDIWDICEAFL